MLHLFSATLRQTVFLRQRASSLHPDCLHTANSLANPLVLFSPFQLWEESLEVVAYHRLFIPLWEVREKKKEKRNRWEKKEQNAITQVKQKQLGRSWSGVIKVHALDIIIFFLSVMHFVIFITHSYLAVLLYETTWCFAMQSVTLGDHSLVLSYLHRLVGLVSLPWLFSFYLRGLAVLGS